MNPYDYAMKMEKEGEDLYREFAREAPMEGLKTVFNWLAEQENIHYNAFKRLKDKKEFKLNPASFWGNVKNLFANWKKNKPGFNFNISQVDVYRKGLDIEQKSIDFYTEQSKKTNNSNEKKILLKIAYEEKCHYEILQNIISFVTKPDTWVENAEFSHIGEEY